MTNTPRGIRNNNPGNLRRSTDPWQGLADRQDDRAFFQFANPVYGIRALARTLIVYQDKYGLGCVGDIVRRWAPAVENNTEAYVVSVEEQTGFDRFEALDLHTYEHLAPIVKAIIRHENGQQPYSDAQIDKALVMVGVEKPKGERLLTTSRTVKGSATGMAGGLSVAAIGASLSDFSSAIPVLREIGAFAREYPGVLLTCIGAAVVFGAGWAIWAKIDDRRRGIA